MKEHIGMSLNSSLIFCSYIDCLTQRGFYEWLVCKIVGKPPSPVTVDVQLVRHVLVSVHVLRLEDAEVFTFNLAHVCGVCLPCDYEKMDRAALGTPHHPSPHIGK